MVITKHNYLNVKKERKRKRKRKKEKGGKYVTK